MIKRHRSGIAVINAMSILRARRAPNRKSFVDTQYGVNGRDRDIQEPRQWVAVESAVIGLVADRWALQDCSSIRLAQ